MNLGFKNRLQTRIHIHNDNKALDRISKFFDDYTLINEDDEFGSFAFQNKQTGDSFNPFYTMPGTGETYEAFRRRELSELKHVEDLQRMTGFVKDWSGLNRADRLDVISKNINAFDQDKGLWLTALTDKECKLIQQSSPDQIYLMMSGLENIDGVRTKHETRKDMMRKHAPEAAASPSLKLAA